MFLPSPIFLGLVTLLLSSFTSVQAVTTCYREDNHNATDSIYTPCNNDHPFSMCYRSQADADGNPADKTCLPNGITQNINITGGYEYWRQSCTDPTWTSPYCLNAFDACPSVRSSSSPVFRMLALADISPRIPIAMYKSILVGMMQPPLLGAAEGTIPHVVALRGQ